VTARFLLDEMLSPAVAEQLVARSIDAAAVAARPDLRTMSDPDILEASAAEGRILVTRNVGDFVRLDAIWGGTGRRHAGILCVATRRFPENSAFIGALVGALVDWAETGRDISGTHAFL
jgi:hypothetical protein